MRRTVVLGIIILGGIITSAIVSAQQGGAPSLIETVTGTVTLHGLAGRVRGVSAVALDGAGRAMGAPIAARRTSAGWVLPIGAPATTWYLVRVERR